MSVRINLISKSAKRFFWSQFINLVELEDNDKSSTTAVSVMNSLPFRRRYKRLLKRSSWVPRLWNHRADKSSVFTRIGEPHRLIWSICWRIQALQVVDRSKLTIAWGLECIDFRDETRYKYRFFQACSSLLQILRWGILSHHIMLLGRTMFEHRSPHVQLFDHRAGNS